MISLRQYYFFALWFPLIAPIVYMIFSAISGELPDDYYIPLIIYCPPYFIFLKYAFIKLREPDIATFFSFTLRVPFYFAAVFSFYFALYVIITAIFTPHTGIGGITEGFAMIITAIIIISYFYIGIMHSLAFVFKKLKVIKE